MFLSFMGPDCVPQFSALLKTRLSARLPRWKGQEVCILDEARRTLFCAIMDWAGVPYADEEVEHRSSDLMLMVDAFGSLGLRHWRGRFARRRSERWVGGIIDAVRAGNARPRIGSALKVIAAHRDRAGNPLQRDVAAVELLNVLRPMMAAAYFIEVAAAALVVYPHLRPAVAGDASALECFVQELRRFTPFTPFLGAEACRDVEWQGFLFPAGTLTVLDVYGIHTDERIWPGAKTFEPGRFSGWSGDPYTLLQQGGGVHASGHRCAGEWLTLEALRVTSQALAALDYTAAVSDLRFNLARVPSRLCKPLSISVG
jgi:fatty-acid peroxygenase